MDMLGESWFGTASRKMEWSAARQKVIAENIANSDTPGYVGRDVTSFEEHLAAARGGPVDTVETGSSWGGSLDGNKVVLEEQMALSRSASSDHNMATSIFRKGHDLLGIAISGN